MTTQDEIYRDWRIPAGTVVFGNAWAILHDPSVYPEPEAFRPERFLVRAAGPTPPSTPDNDLPSPSTSPTGQAGAIFPDSTRYGTGTSEWAPRPNASDPRSAAFGFGRRVCPGSHLADQALFAGVASILATFYVAPAHGGEMPRLQDEKGWMTGGYISHPREFECVIRPRYEGVEGLVRAGMEDTGDVF
jgi:cytochrome P450